MPKMKTFKDPSSDAFQNKSVKKKFQRSLEVCPFNKKKIIYFKILFYPLFSPLIPNFMILSLVMGTF